MQNISSYCYGYLIALTVFEADKIEIDDTESNQALAAMVTHFDSHTFGSSTEIRSRIDVDMASRDNVDKLKIILNEIDEYFCVFKNNEVKQ